LLSGCRYTVKFLSDDSRRNGSDAVELLKFASDRPQLIDRLDALSVEHVPGKLRQIEILNRPFAGWEMARHLLFLSLPGGAHASLSRRCLITHTDDILLYAFPGRFSLSTRAFRIMGHLRFGGGKVGRDA
jgi:hypothetical protein